MPKLHEYEEATCPDDEYAVLRALVDAGPSTFVSGSVLAEELGVSRPTAWAKIRRLTNQGFAFEAVRNRGYRLVSEPVRLHAGLLHYCFGKDDDAPPVRYYPVIDSTNSEAERLLSYGEKTPFCIVSSCQEQGRGRLGRNWFSASADNLYLSVAFAPEMPPKRLQDFTLWAGIHICRTLQARLPGAALQIKWPNDLVCRGRKFAGMLTEAKMDADRTRSIVFGLGLNLNSNPQEYPPEIRRKATSLRAVAGDELPMNRVATEVAAAVCRAYGNCIGNRAPEPLTAAWETLDALAGQDVTARRGLETIMGKAAGIAPDGALRIASPDGSVHTVRAGDVTLSSD